MREHDPWSSPNPVTAKGQAMIMNPGTGVLWHADKIKLIDPIIHFLTRLVSHFTRLVTII